MDQLSNIDGIVDRGTHSNFTAMKYGPDSISDTLTETNIWNGTGTWTKPTVVYSKCGEENGYGATNTIDGSTSTEWRHSASEMHWIVFNMGKGMKTTKVRIYTGSSPQQYTLEHVKVYVSNDTTFDESEVVISDWTLPQSGWAVSPVFNKIGRYIKLTNLDPTTPNNQLKMCFYEFDAWTEINYVLDLEAQWTNVKYTEVNEQLCIYGRTMGSEDIRVDVWNGSKWVNIATDLYQGWNNISVSDYLKSSTFTIRFRGGTEANDTAQDSWHIDSALLHVWTLGVDNYELNLEAQFTNAQYNEVNQKLCIYAGNLTSESLRVDYWNGTGWTNIITSLSANGWNNISVSLTNFNFTIRFRGALETGDSTQDHWKIDAVLLHVWTLNLKNYEADLEVQWTNVDSHEIYKELCIYTGNLTSEDLRVDVWTQNNWVTIKAKLNPYSWNNISISNYLKNSTLTIRFKGTSEVDDTVQDHWQIDAALLHVWTVQGYQLDLESQFTSLDYSQEKEELCIYAGSLTSEALGVDY